MSVSEGAEDDLWVTFLISVWLQECFDGCFIVAWSETQAAPPVLRYLSQLYKL